nr:hypothetical protein [Pseudosulfitobacter pseudonitzschiae]
MPAILKHTVSGARAFDGEVHRTWFIENPEANYPDRIERPFTPEERTNLATIGAESWYDWSIKNWGTKWNAYQATDSNGVLRFQTAWSTPMPIWHALAAKFPDETIKIEYADEDMGQNCGTIYLRGGDVISEDGALSFSHQIWGQNDEDRIEQGLERAEYER